VSRSLVQLSRVELPIETRIERFRTDEAIPLLNAVITSSVLDPSVDSSGWPVGCTGLEKGVVFRSLLYVVDHDHIAVDASTRQNYLFAIGRVCEIEDHSAGEIRNPPRKASLHRLAPEI
jgi:hypothetical protein